MIGRRRWFRYCFNVELWNGRRIVLLVNQPVIVVRMMMMVMVVTAVVMVVVFFNCELRNHGRRVRRGRV